MYTPMYQGGQNNLGGLGTLSQLGRSGSLGAGISAAEYERLFHNQQTAVNPQINAQPIVGLPYDAMLRVEALKLAHDPNMAADSITHRAKAYLEFLRGDGSK